MSSHHLKAKPPRPDSISHCISPVASAWNMNRPDDPAEPEADPLDAVMSGFALNAIERSEYSTSRHDVERKERTNVEGIAMMERRYRWPSFLHYFRDVQREREYERWYWKRNRRAWIRSVGYMLAAALCYYAQFLIVGPIQAQSFREKREKDPDG
ncbi:hypothetical protein BC829DRAFT_265911 [Chytridium lagenaria]|nr:hypothetical protein BC829DRAFT_265911 [Chytridium lagenaria]